MRPTAILMLSAAMLALLLLGFSQPASATKTLAEQEDANCTACHDKPGSKLLTDKGKYYESVRSLDGFDEIRGTFGQCTRCHNSKPGSPDLTGDGKKIRSVANDMEELKAWVLSQHPAPPPVDDAD